uniref:Seven TM Receptor n=1 Tax=Caenorhabditis tropicalis TaxID=1561998 RepID=A0A1I7U2I7_9PELO
MTSPHTIYPRITSSIAIINNVLLILLILFKSHPKVGKYKILMIYISVFEILYAILDATIFTKESMFIVVIYNEKTLAPNFFSDIFCHWFCVFFGISMAVFAVHFIYRYLVVSGKYHLSLIGINLTDISYTGVYFWPIGADGQQHINWKSTVGILIIIMAVAASVAIIFIFGYKCYVETHKLIESASQSASFNKLQSQLFYALVFQTLIPVVLMHIPASIGFIASFFNMSMEVFGDFCFSTICLYPVLDPLPNFFIIKNYRDAIWKEIQTFKRWIVKCKGGSTVEVEIPMSSKMTSLSRDQSQTAQN